MPANCVFLDVSLWVRSLLLCRLLVFGRLFQVVSSGLVQGLLLSVEFLSRVLQPMLVTRCGGCASPVALALVRGVGRGLGRCCLICMWRRRILHQAGSSLG